MTHCRLKRERKKNQSELSGSATQVTSNLSNHHQKESIAETVYFSFVLPLYDRTTERRHFDLLIYLQLITIQRSSQDCFHWLKGLYKWGQNVVLPLYNRTTVRRKETRWSRLMLLQQPHSERDRGCERQHAGQAAAILKLTTKSKNGFSFAPVTLRRLRKRKSLILPLWWWMNYCSN